MLYPGIHNLHHSVAEASQCPTNDFHRVRQHRKSQTRKEGIENPIDQDVVRKSVCIRFGRSHALDALFKSFLPACTSTRLAENFIPCFDTLALGVCAITLIITIRVGSVEARRAYRS